MKKPADNNRSNVSDRAPGMSHKQIAIVILICFASAAAGYFIQLPKNQSNNNSSAAPKVYVERCGFHFKGKSCGGLVRNIIFLSSDEFLSFTDNWAVGRVDDYKIYMSCFGPGDENFIDGTFSSLTVVVAGPNLSKAYEMANQLIVDFSAELTEQSDSISHCIEQK